MGLLENSIRQKINEVLRPSHFELLNESGGHRVPLGSETHFRLIVVSPLFEGLGRVARHQRIYQLLTSEREQGLHALALWTYTPEEWKTSDLNRESPTCRGQTE